MPTLRMANQYCLGKDTRSHHELSFSPKSWCDELQKYPRFLKALQHLENGQWLFQIPKKKKQLIQLPAWCCGFRWCSSASCSHGDMLEECGERGFVTASLWNSWSAVLGMRGRTHTDTMGRSSQQHTKSKPTRMAYTTRHCDLRSSFPCYY